MRFLSISTKRFWLFTAFTVVVAVLMVVVFFGAVRFLFGRSPIREFEALRRSADPGQLQSWALETLQQFPNETNAVFAGDSGRLVLSNRPAFLSRVPTFGAVGPEVIISGLDVKGERHVELVYFYGGWGHGQTIFAGSPAFTMPTNSRCFHWASGVYYKAW
jgi:hypothetical protein